VKSKNLFKSFKASKVKTLTGSLFHAVNLKPNAEIYKLLSKGQEIGSLSRVELYQNSLTIAAMLQKHGVKGERILLLIPSSLDFLTAFMGCLYAGAIAVPAYTASNQRNIARIKMIIDDCKPKIILSLSNIDLEHIIFSSETNVKNTFKVINLDQIDSNTDTKYQEIETNENDVAFLQYTSGSTSKPKGVMISHKNLYRNLSLIAKCYNLNHKSIIVSWLPIHHDLGLVSVLLQSIYCGGKAIFMATEDFMRSPLIWLKSISKYKATVTAAPNFAYDLCTLKKISTQDALSLDLSSLKTAINAAEPIKADTIIQFSKKFATYGLKNFVSAPSYGMAEAVVFISTSNHTEEPIIKHFNKKLLELELKAVSEPKSLKTKSLVSCGAAQAIEKLLIIDPNNLTKCADNAVGEIWIKDLSVATGYWQKPELTTETFHAIEKTNNTGPYLRTGDLGFLHEGQLYIAGRRKDIFIINGQNIYPQDIEFIIENIDPKIRRNTAAAFAVEVAGLERIIIVQEANFTDNVASEIFDKITTAINSGYKLMPYDIAFIKKGTINKTTSGKIQRQLCRKLYLENKLEIIVSLRTLKQLNTKALKYPKTPIEKHLAKLWQENLNLDVNYKISLDDNFFYLGGNSVTATSILLLIADHYNKFLSLKDFFNNPSLKLLSRKISNLSEKTLLATPNKEKIKHIPLSPEQLNLWFSDQQKNIQNNIIFKITLDGMLDISILEKSLIKILSRHQILSTIISSQKDYVTQEVNHNLTLPLEILFNNSLEEIHSIINADINNPFSYAKEALFRIKLFCNNHRNYVLYFNFNHIIADAISINILITELGVIYNSYLNQNTSNINEISYQYFDYSIFKQNYLTEDVKNAQLDFWCKTLYKANHSLSIPTDSDLTANKSNHIVQFEQNIDSNILSSLHLMSKKHNTSLFMLFIVSLYLMLRKYANQSDMLIYTPFSVRKHPDFSDLIGCFINSLPVRIKSSNNQTIEELIFAAKENILNIYENLDVTLADILNNPDSKINITKNNLSRILFAFQNFEEPNLNLEKINNAKIEQLHSNSSEFDLSFIVNIFAKKKAQNIPLIIEYNSKLYKEETIRKMAKNYVNILALLPNFYNTKISNFSFTRAEDQRMLTVDLNSKINHNIINHTIHELFAEQATKQPNKIAINTANKSISYNQLNKDSDSLANYLYSLNVKSEDIITIFLDRSIDMITAILAILKSGGAYLNIDPKYPDENIKHILSDTSTNIIITEPKYQHKISNISNSTTKIIDITNIKDQLAQAKLKCSTPKVLASNLAYVMYTSGTTSSQKGVLIEHKSVVNNSFAAIENYKINKQDIILQSSTAAFDIFVEEVFPTLIAGASLLIIDKETLLDKDELFKFLYKFKPSIINLSTTLWANLVTYSFPPNIKLCIIGGDKLKKTQYNIWQNKNKIPVINTYGPTETTVIAALYHCEDKQYQEDIPIGKPIVNTQIFILDGNLNILPSGVIGELYISGVGLARGYLNNKKLTQEKFLPHPFLPEQKIYKTGDLAKINSDGNIEFIGRKDVQIKHQGYRIELSDIDDKILENKNIRNSITISKDGKLINFYVAKQDVEQHALHNYLSKELPHYMLPTNYNRLKEMPLTINGKIDTKSLLNEKINFINETNISPRNTKDKILLKIWQESLKVGNISINDNYNCLGGNSLKSIHIIHKIRQAGYDISPRDLFCYPTIAELSDNMQPLNNTSKQGHKGNIEKLLLPSQLWFLDKQINLYNQWNQSALFELKKEIPLDSLKNALYFLINKHPNFSLRFKKVNKNFVQLFDECKQELKLLSYDLNHIANHDSFIKSIIIKIEKSLNLESGPVISCAYFHSNKKQYLFITMHHLITDGISWQIALNDLDHYLTSNEQNLDISNYTNDYFSYLAKFYEYTNSENLKTEYEYWKKLLKKSLAIHQAKKTYTKDRENNAGYFSNFLNKEETKILLKKSASNLGASVNEILIALLVQQYCKYHNISEIQIDLEDNGRDILEQKSDVFNLIGWFANIFPVIFAMKETNISEFIQYVKKKLTEIPNKGAGFGIYKYIKHDKLLKNFPQSAILFNFLGELDLENSLLKLKEFNLENFYDQNSSLTYDLEIHAFILQKKLCFHYKYNKNIYSTEQIKEYCNMQIDAIKKIQI
jgi:amino acid adenylation domain-containing protein/non-ribosomal peptide synthase protein (TIGR01720 family)